MHPHRHPRAYRYHPTSHSTSLPFPVHATPSPCCLLHPRSTCKQCNPELGVCECPVGWTGPACEQPTLPACRTTASRTGVPIVIGRAAPRNCHCYRQLLNKTCLTGPQSVDRCASRTVVLWDTIKCFEYVGVPDEQQLSDLPEGSADKGGVRWMHGVISSQGVPVSGESSNATATPYTRELRPLPEAPKHEYLPLARCPNRWGCRGQGHGRGSCGMWRVGIAGTGVSGLSGTNGRARHGRASANAHCAAASLEAGESWELAAWSHAKGPRLQAFEL